MQSVNENDTPVIGKHILSTLTIGMYQDPRMIYREYIQNSADQIDMLSADERRDNIRQTIVIDIDERKRIVEITDRATGIPRKDFRKRLLNVADSQKDPSKNKGFRGIGRLAGLNYCRTLIFESSAKGETVVSRLEMDAHEMIHILHDTNDHSLAGDVIKKISKVSYIDGVAKEYDCYFKVTLQDVRLDVGKQLLDIESVKEFVAQIAPVPFSNLRFRIGKQIMEAATKAGVLIEEYTVRVNGETITKLYRDVVYDARSNELGTVGQPVYRSIDWGGKRLAWGWFLLPRYGVSLAESTNPQRKVRLRKGNIQIGFDNFLDPYFPEARSNGYMLGEIYLLSDSILPNGDRNALEVSEEASALTEQLRNVIFRDLWNAAHKASELNSAQSAVKDYESQRREMERLVRENATAAVEAKKPELEKAYARAIAGQQKIKKVAGAPVKGEFVKQVVDVLTGEVTTTSTSLVKPEEIAVVPSRVSPKTGSKVVRVKTTGTELMNVIIRVLVEDGLDVMRAHDLAKKISDEISPAS